jgi:hypothetical protein
MAELSKHGGTVVVSSEEKCTQMVMFKWAQICALKHAAHGAGSKYFIKHI